MGRVVIVGGGAAGFEVAFSLRARKYEGEIVLVSAEEYLPYHRPPLSKEVLVDAAEPVALLRQPGYYEDNDITTLLGRHVVSVDRSARAVVLDDGERLPYEHLVLATGAANRVLDVPGARLPGVVYLRRPDEAVRLRSLMSQASSVAVVGAGFIGLEVASAASRLGKQVEVLEADERVMGRAVSGPMSSYFAELHARHGVAIHTREVVSEICGSERATGVRTRAGRAVAADLVVVGIGVVAETSLAESAGLEVRGGVVVDEDARTGDERVSAVGDCVVRPHGDRMVRVESVQNATDQARRVAARLVGDESGRPEVPWFWSHQYDAKLQIAGIAAPGAQCVVRGDPGSDAFSVFVFDAQTRLAAVESVNRPKDHMTARRLLQSGALLTAQQAADPQFDLAAYAKQTRASA